jgi:hypothetical protein
LEARVSVCNLDIISAQHIWNTAVLGKSWIHKLLQIVNAAAFGIGVAMVPDFVQVIL